jgi:hypothetical protein
MTRNHANHHDEGTMLQCRSVRPLDPRQASADAELADSIEQHNERMAAAIVRLQKLAKDRQRLVDFDAWQDADSTAIIELRDHVRQESWNAATEIKRLFRERHALLKQIEASLDTHCHSATEECDREEAAAEQRLAKERRALVKANPVTANAHFHDLVTGEESVQAAAERVRDLRDQIEGIASQSRQCHHDELALTHWLQAAFADLVK